MESAPIPFMNFHVLLDVVVLLAYFSVIIGIGLAQRSKSNSVEGFALGDRQTPWWAVLASILAAEISAATFLGNPETGYKDRNWVYGQFAIGTILARIIVSYLFIPIFYRHGVVSLYEFLGTRFGRRTRVWASGTFLVTRVLAMGSRLYVSAIILVLAFQLAVGGIADPWHKFGIFAGAVVLVTMLTALYTTVGGIRAVIWTDFIQVGVLFSAVGFSLFYLLSQIHGGWDAVKANLIPTGVSLEGAGRFFIATGKPTGDDWTMWQWVKTVLTSDYTIWGAIFGSTFTTMATHGIDQDTVQRMLTAKNRKESARATILSGLADVPVVFCFILMGILVYTFYHQAGGKELPAHITKNEAFPYFILTEMPAGLRGLVVAGVMATAMGSLSTALNALGTSHARDFVIPRREALGPVTEAERVRVLRSSTVLFSVFIILVGVGTAAYAVWDSTAQILPLVLGIIFSFGPLLGIFLLGVLTTGRGSERGNVFAMITAFIIVLVLSNAWIQSSLASALDHLWPGLAVRKDGVVQPWLVLAFAWRIMLGALITFGIAVCFPTRKETQA